MEAYPIDMKRDLQKFQQAQDLRRKGESIRQIAKVMQISTSTASIWCMGIDLTQDQRKVLSKRGLHIEKLKAFSLQRHNEKIAKDKEDFQRAFQEIQLLNNSNLFLVGLALYWAEGFKSIKEQRVGFCNSDPRMVKFIMKWFREALYVSAEDFVLRAEFNIEHEHRKEDIERYWAALTGIPRSQFNKPFLQKAKLVRSYNNQNTYFGVLRIRIRKSSRMLVKLRGWIQGLSLA